MAYVALVSLAQTIDHILNHDHYPISLPNKELIISIDKYVFFLQVYLQDFPEKANSLEGRISDVANETEGVIEHLMLEQILGRSRVKFNHQLKRVKGKINSMAVQVMHIKNVNRVENSDFCAASSSSRLAPYTGKDGIVGLEEDLLAIKERICGESSKRQVIPILGMGGIGKTTLARNAYDDHLVMEHFQIHAWVIVSQDYSAQEILLRLLDSVKELNVER